MIQRKQESKNKVSYEHLREVGDRLMASLRPHFEKLYRKHNPLNVTFLHPGSLMCKQLLSKEEQWITHVHKGYYLVRANSLFVVLDESLPEAVLPKAFEGIPVDYVVYHAPQRTACYRDKDMRTPEWRAAITEATALWSRLCEEFYAAHGDGGSCVLGAGIAVRYLPPRCRNNTLEIVIHDYQGFRSQSCAVHEATKMEVIIFLASKGIEAVWDAGHMG
jgi:hypothetical protein